MSNRCRKLVSLAQQRGTQSHSSCSSSKENDAPSLLFCCNSSVQITEEHKPANKIKIVEDWLLGVEPKRLYSQKDNSSIFFETKTDHLFPCKEKQQSSSLTENKSDLTNPFERSNNETTSIVTTWLPPEEIHVLTPTVLSLDDLQTNFSGQDEVRNYLNLNKCNDEFIQSEEEKVKKSNNVTSIASPSLLPEQMLVLTPTDVNSEDSQLHLDNQTEVRHYLNKSNNEFVQSEEEEDQDDDSIMDPDYQPVPPDGNIRSFPSFSEESNISKVSMEIKTIPRICIEDEKLNLQEMVETVSRKNYTDRKDFCIFCEKDVSHFSRHVYSWHEKEFDVQKILSLKRNSKERRQALSGLRKKGNFLRNRSEKTLRPVKRLPTKQKFTNSDIFLPCKYCLGFYMKHSLYRHTKKCSFNDEVCNKKKQTAQSDGQTTLLLYSLHKQDELLKSKIFPRMRADDIGLIAKQDKLICRFAYSYIKGRQSKGNLDLVRQNMRRLAKLLQYARAKNSEIKNLIDLLRPQYFKLIIAGVNKMAHYNQESDIYESPTLAINFGTLIKKCCDLAYIDLLQVVNTDDQRKDLKVLKELIISQWADEVSAQAGTNLNQNRWNKDELLPLTSDLKKLISFLQNIAEKSFNDLMVNQNDMLSYTTLKDVLYTQIILLNRRRPAEVAQLTVSTFKSINLERENNNEFEKCLTETEKILLSTFSRFVIRGKRGRGVPVLLSPQMKKHFYFLLEVRKNFVSDNGYVFHTTGKGFIDGTKVIHKYVNKCKLEKPECITATGLRKHLATITQLLQFSDHDMEQLSKFMGHTLKTHCGVYRMSDTIYQTAKVSKLLLLMTEGGADEFRGKSLDEINIDLNPVYDNENLLNYDHDLEIPSQEIHQSHVKDIQKTMKSKITRKSSNPHKLDERQSWSQSHKNLIAQHFSQNIQEKKPPKKHLVKEFMNLHSEIFKDKKWTSIKAMVYNMYSGKLKY